MIGKFLAQLVGTVEENRNNVSVETDNCANLFEFEDGEWLIINIHKNQSLGSVEAAFPENLLIEHPSMSVYQMKPEEDDIGSEEESEDIAKPMPIRRNISWQLAAWGSPLPCSTVLLSVQRARVHTEQRKLSRGVLNRRNLVKTRFSSSERRFFKQPSRRLYNY